MNTLTELKKEHDILHFPRLDNVLMVENFVREHDGEFKKRKLWESLPKRLMYQTYMLIIDYLVYSNKVSIDSEGKIGWMYYPKKVEGDLKHRKLFLRG